MSQDVLKLSDQLKKRMDKIHVLVVDGSAKVGDLIKSILNQLGFNNIFIADNGLNGIKMTHEVKIDIIITDSELLICKTPATANDDAENKHEIMPISGPLFVKRLRFSPNSPSPFVPIIMLLKSATPQEVFDARDAGVNEIVLKPFRADEFCQKIRTIIELPRIFITSDTYRGPCRRREKKALPPEMKDRRKKVVQLIRLNGNRGR